MLGFRKGNQAAAGMDRDYGWDNVMLSTSPKESFDRVKNILETYLDAILEDGELEAAG